MSKKNYIQIQPPIEVNLVPISNPERHLDISTRGIIATISEPIDIGTTVQGNLKVVTLTGSLDFQGKIFECDRVAEGNFEVSVKFYGLTHDKENEVYTFIQDHS